MKAVNKLRTRLNNQYLKSDTGQTLTALAEYLFFSVALLVYCWGVHCLSWYVYQGS